MQGIERFVPFSAKNLTDIGSIGCNLAQDFAKKILAENSFTISTLTAGS